MRSSMTVSIDDKVEVLLEVADGLHPVEQPASADLQEWEDWTVARRLRETAADLVE